LILYPRRRKQHHLSLIFHPHPPVDCFTWVGRLPRTLSPSALPFRRSPMDSNSDNDPAKTHMDDSNAIHPEENLAPIDLVGAPFAVIESDPGVFTSLARRLGVRGLELVELFDIEPDAVAHLAPRGLVFCFMWRKDTHRARDFADPAAQRVWFANQLSGDACASLALLNIVFNCPEVELGETLGAFKRETEGMSAVMKGLAISSSPFIRETHRSLARPSDLRAALNAIATATLENAEREKELPPPGKRTPAAKRAASSSNSKQKKEEPAADASEAYHFIGYVPAYSKVWELDGLKSGPLEVGVLASNKTDAAQKSWMDVVRPAIRNKMRKYGGDAESGDNIRFSLLALVDGLYEKASDDFEFLRRECVSIQRRMGSRWEARVDSRLLDKAKETFDYRAAEPQRTYSVDFGTRRMARDVEILNMPDSELVSAWEQCVTDAARARISLEDEVTKAIRENTEDIKRTHDYEPFLAEFVKCMEKEGLLEAILDGDGDGKKKGKRAKTR
ncbi:cysteine proteinase, partial [Mycena latifolia]